MNKKLIKATRDFAQKYKTFKAAEKRKDSTRTAFFNALNEDLLEGTSLPRRTIKLDGIPEGEEIAWVKTHYPGWVLLVTNDLGESRRGIIEQDPAFMSHKVVLDGIVYGREIAERAPSLNEARLKTEDKALWKAVTKPARALKDPSEWTDEQAAQLQEYFTPGPLQAKISTPRGAKPEDLQDES